MEGDELIKAMQDWQPVDLESHVCLLLLSLSLSSSLNRYSPCANHYPYVLSSQLVCIVRLRGAYSKYTRMSQAKRMPAPLMSHA